MSEIVIVDDMNWDQEVLRSEIPVLDGYVLTTPKPTAQVPLVSPLGDPLLAHWQFGLGRAVAWLSDSQGRWTARFAAR